MTRLDVITFLLDEAKTEQERLKQYEAAEEAAREKAEQAEKDGKKYVSYYTYLKWDGNVPRKSVILHNLRTVRRLAMQEIKEMQS